MNTFIKTYTEKRKSGKEERLEGFQSLVYYKKELENKYLNIP